MNTAPLRPRVVLLGAAPAARGDLPAAMQGVGANSTVLDWLLQAFTALDQPEISLVAGYKIADIATDYPDLHLIANRDWASTGPVQSLALVDFDDQRSTWVSYADVVFRSEAVRAVDSAPGDIVIAVDSQWRDRYDNRSRGAVQKAEKVAIHNGQAVRLSTKLSLSDAHAEFAGLVRFAPRSVDAVRAALISPRFDRRSGLGDLLQHLIELGLAVTTVDLEGKWAELDARQDLARFVLGTKAESLERLRTMAHGGHIGEQVTFTQQRWTRQSNQVVQSVLDHFGNQSLIVRSSAVTEDTWNESGAGRHDSVLDVAPHHDTLRSAVDRVLASYGAPLDANQVLIQAMLTDVAMSGVVMTRTHATGAPYYVINFDDSTHRTDTVTSGQDARTIVVLRGASVGCVEAALAPVLEVVTNIERFVGHDALDIEFAVTDDGTVHILQVRPIAIDHNTGAVDDAATFAAVNACKRLFEQHRERSFVLGSAPYFSVMTDWNPAEIVGTKPRRLSLSLYRYLITDEVWAQQRFEYGYRDLRSCPLLIDFAGHPYVDVRASFTSFVPSVLDDTFARRLVEHYLAMLRADPTLHDKVEFDIVVSCMTPSFAMRAERLQAAGFGSDEIAQLQAALADLTMAGIARTPRDTERMRAIRDSGRKVGSINGDSTKAEARQASAVPLNSSATLERACRALDDARRDATLVFAHLARSAFVATDILRGLLETKAISRDRHDEFLASTETVFGRLQRDAALVGDGQLPWETLVGRYGHLRPGTYDITSATYREARDVYLQPAVALVPTLIPPSAKTGALAVPFAWSATEAASIEESLRRCGLDVTIDSFNEFARSAISGREEAKFVFTRALSDALEAIAEWGETRGLNRDTLANLDIADIMRCRDAVVDEQAYLAQRCAEGARAFGISQSMWLPGQLSDERDFEIFEQPEAEANFVTQHTVEARVVDFANDPHAAVEGAIVMIPSADPGYDGLLARGIAGLITMYGGANSHMAVRAAETALPAAIGIGEQRFNTLRAANTLRIECAERRIVVIP